MTPMDALLADARRDCLPLEPEKKSDRPDMPEYFRLLSLKAAMRAAGSRQIEHGTRCLRAAPPLEADREPCWTGEPQSLYITSPIWVPEQPEYDELLGERGVGFRTLASRRNAFGPFRGQRKEP